MYEFEQPHEAKPTLNLTDFSVGVQADMDAANATSTTQTVTQAMRSGMQSYVLRKNNELSEHHALGSYAELPNGAYILNKKSGELSSYTMEEIEGFYDGIVVMPYAANNGPVQFQAFHIVSIVFREGCLVANGDKALLEIMDTDIALGATPEYFADGEEWLNLITRLLTRQPVNTIEPGEFAMMFTAALAVNPTQFLPAYTIQKLLGRLHAVTQYQGAYTELTADEYFLQSPSRGTIFCSNQSSRRVGGVVDRFVPMEDYEVVTHAPGVATPQFKDGEFVLGVAMHADPAAAEPVSIIVPAVRIQFPIEPMLAQPSD